MGVGAYRATYDPLLPRPTSSVSGIVTDATTYNSYGELASYSASASGSLIFRDILDTTASPRDPLGRIAQRSETSDGVTTTNSYEYDLQGRLSEVRQDGDLTESYSYDYNGNRLTFETPEGSISARHQGTTSVAVLEPPCHDALRVTCDTLVLRALSTISGAVTDAFAYNGYGGVAAQCRVGKPPTTSTGTG